MPPKSNTPKPVFKALEAAGDTPSLRLGLVELLNDLNTLARNTGDADLLDDLIKLIRVLSKLLEEVLRKTIDKTTADYTAALTSLDKAVTAAKAAVADIAKTADAIKKAKSVAKAVDKVVGLIGGFL